MNLLVADSWHEKGTDGRHNWKKKVYINNTCKLALGSQEGTYYSDTINHMYDVWNDWHVFSSVFSIILTVYFNKEYKLNAYYKEKKISELSNLKHGFS